MMHGWRMQLRGSGSGGDGGGAGRSGSRDAWRRLCSAVLCCAVPCCAMLYCAADGLAYLPFGLSRHDIVEPDRSRGEPGKVGGTYGWWVARHRGVRGGAGTRGKIRVEWGRRCRVRRQWWRRRRWSLRRWQRRQRRRVVAVPCNNVACVRCNHQRGALSGWWRARGGGGGGVVVRRGGGRL